MGLAISHSIRRRRRPVSLGLLASAAFITSQLPGCHSYCLWMQTSSCWHRFRLFRTVHTGVRASLPTPGGLTGYTQVYPY
jgi:hypothetical protein